MKLSFRDSIWRLRDVRVILPARALSQAGTSLTTVVVLLHLYDLGVGPVGIAALLGCLMAPTIVTMGLAGRVANGTDSRRVLVVCGLVQAAVCAGLGVAHPVAAIYPAMIVLQLAAAFSQPTWSALVPRVVGEDRIGKAVSWQQGLGALATPLGTAAGGMLVGLGQLRLALWIDAASYLVLAAAALAVRTRRAPDRQEATARVPWSAGLRVVHADRIVWPLFTGLLVFVVLVEGVNPAEVFLARGVLGATPFQYGLSDIFLGVGALAGSAISGRIVSNERRVPAAILGFGSAALMLVLGGLSPFFWVYLVVMAALTAGFSTGNATFGALLMGRTPDGDRGKVYAALGGLARTASLIALVLGGAATTLISPRWVFVGAGLAGTLCMLVTLIQLRRSERRNLPLNGMQHVSAHE